jgi:FdrA protein
MSSGFVIRKNQYYDSLVLMRIASSLSGEPGVTQAAVLMATDANKSLLAEIGFDQDDIRSAKLNDLVVALIAADSSIVDHLLAGIDLRFRNISIGQKRTAYNNIREAAQSVQGTNLAVISIPGEFAAQEARKAIDQGLHVFLFSNNVPLDEEIALKQLARERGLLVMGPDCGTSLIQGVGVGFANAVRRGPIGVVGPSGTGIQEFTSMVHQAGSGISHAIGTGSRDLSDAVGGITTLMGLDLLETDKDTRLIVLVSKPAGNQTITRIVDRIRASTKPFIGCFLGLERPVEGFGESYYQAKTIDDAAQMALQMIGEVEERVDLTHPSWDWSRIEQEIAGWSPDQRYIRGLFAGGTFCYQAQQIMKEARISVYSNVPRDKLYHLKNPETSLEHTFVDMGDDYFTRGKPHPMIDANQRRKRILAESSDPEVAILLIDIILGQIASPDPAGDLVKEVRTAMVNAERRGGHLTVVASLCGTDQDPQGLSRQRVVLEETGALVFRSNAMATRFCRDLILAREGKAYG